MDLKNWKVILFDSKVLYALRGENTSLSIFFKKKNFKSIFFLIYIHMHYNKVCVTSITLNSPNL